MRHVMSGLMIVAFLLFAQSALATATSDLAFPPGDDKVSTGTARGTASANRRTCDPKGCIGAPFYKNVWFWALVGVTVVTATSIAIALRPTADPARKVLPPPMPSLKPLLRF